MILCGQINNIGLGFAVFLAIAVIAFVIVTSVWLYYTLTEKWWKI